MVAALHGAAGGDRAVRHAPERDRARSRAARARAGDGRGQGRLRLRRAEPAQGRPRHDRAAGERRRATRSSSEALPLDREGRAQPATSTTWRARSCSTCCRRPSRRGSSRRRCAREAMGITGFTLATMYRWIRSDAGPRAHAAPVPEGALPRQRPGAGWCWRRPGLDGESQFAGDPRLRGGAEARRGRALIDDVRRILTRSSRPSPARSSSSPTTRSSGGPSRECTNSAGNLALHACGNLRHFVGACSAAPGTCATGRRSSRHEPAGARTSRGRCATRRASSRRPSPASPRGPSARACSVPHDGVQLPCGRFLLHLCVHLSFHLGQAGYLRRSLTGDGRTSGAVSLAACSDA